MKAIDPLNAQIMTECCRLGPNNLSKVARSLKLPVETVRYRFNKLRRLGVFRFDVFAHYSKLGLIRCSVFATPTPPGEQIFDKVLTTLEYWTYLARSYGSYEGRYGVYALPIANRADFEDYLNEAAKLGIIENLEVVFTGDSYTITPDFQTFNFKKHYWIFPWNDWIKKAKSEPADLSHPALRDPEEYSSRIDVTDLQILALLEQDAARGLREIGRNLGLTASGVKYHWDHHIAAPEVVQGFRTLLTGYPMGLSDIFAFKFVCADEEKLAKLVNFFSDKVFVVSFAKVLRKNDLIVHVAIPKTEFESMMAFMYGIRSAELVRDFTYVRLDLRSYSAETIRPANFRNGRWSYERKAQLAKLDKFMRTKASPNRSIQRRKETYDAE